MITRREMAVGSALSLLFLAGAPSEAHAVARRRKNSRTPNTRGCWLAHQDVPAVYGRGTETRLYARGDEPMIPRSGNRDFDYALAQTLAKISNIFDVLPGFAYYDDFDSKNAYATDLARLDRADGTVLFGQGLLSELMSGTESPEVAVAAVCAHEFGHVLQFRRGLLSVVDSGQATVKRSELQADFFAGYFAGQRRKERRSFPAAVVALTMHNFGDYNTEHSNHHGTPEERGAAVVRGYEAAFVEGRSLGEAIELSIAYVSRA